MHACKSDIEGGEPRAVSRGRFRFRFRFRLFCFVFFFFFFQFFFSVLSYSTVHLRICARFVFHMRPGHAREALSRCHPEHGDADWPLGWWFPLTKAQ